MIYSYIFDLGLADWEFCDLINTLVIELGEMDRGFGGLINALGVDV